MPRVRPLLPIFASDRPFEGQGVSVYAHAGETVLYRSPRVVFRRHRRQRRVWIKSPEERIPLDADPIPKTLRRTSLAGVAGNALGIPLTLLAEWASQTIAIDVRHYRDDVEHLSDNVRPVRVDLDGTLDPVAEIRGTAILLETQIRAGGIVRLRWRWIAALDGTQPTLFRASRTAGPTSPAAVTTTANGSGLYEVDTPALNSAAYTYKLTAENGAVTKDVLTGITFTADGTGPPAVTQVLTDAR